MVYRNSVSLTFDGFVNLVLTAVGVSSSGLRKVWADPEHSNQDVCVDGEINTSCKPMTHLARDIYRYQLQPGPKLESLTRPVLCSIRDSLTWPATTKTKRVSLMKWCGEVLIEGATKAMFGDELLRIEPELVSTFMKFNDNAWMLLFKYPRIAAPKMYAARDKIVGSLLQYSRSSENPVGESYLVQFVRINAKKFEIGERDCARMMFILFWA